MNYKLTYTPRAERDIKKLDPAAKNRIGKALLKLQANPLLYSDKLRDPSIGTYRFRIGDYRVIFDIEGNDIVVLRIGHRKEIYKRLQ
ncbi:MAG: type II toxin-antitoxin system RelE/ParE family toxin [Planctomycetes bacterium]|nr:type II toxin-antitoxin system RelE/ParE family toxin [Planctomycetota bacterium]